MAQVVARDLINSRDRRRRDHRGRPAHNISVGLQYIESWLRRQRRGADQQPDGGRRHRRDLPRAALAVGARITAALAGDGVNVGAARLTSALYEGVRDAELARLERAAPDAAGRLRTAAELLDAMVLADGCAGFLTLAAYGRLVEG